MLQSTNEKASKLGLGNLRNVKYHPHRLKCLGNIFHGCWIPGKQSCWDLPGKLNNANISLSSELSVCLLLINIVVLTLHICFNIFCLDSGLFAQKKCNRRNVMSICSEKRHCTYVHSLVVPAISMKEWCGELFSFWIYCLKLLHDIGSGYQRLLIYFCITVLSWQTDNVKNQFKLWKNHPSYSTYIFCKLWWSLCGNMDLNM